jgi:hypothetical protein
MVSGFRQEHTLPPVVVVKVQTVQEHRLETSSMGIKSIGNWIDNAIADGAREGQFANRIVIDLNPVQVNPLACE